jgi:hypothetical protein
MGEYLIIVPNCFHSQKNQFQSPIDPAYACVQTEVNLKTPRYPRGVRAVDGVGLEPTTSRTGLQLHLGYDFDDFANKISLK